jgi:hypothetical protein
MRETGGGSFFCEKTNFVLTKWIPDLQHEECKSTAKQFVLFLVEILHKTVREMRVTGTKHPASQPMHNAHANKSRISGFSA